MLNFSELKRLKLQQLLLDIDLEQVCEALRSAEKLEILDLSHNELYKPECLVELFKSLKHLKILDLSDNDIQLGFIAEGFKFLTTLQQLYLSGNIISFSNEGFGSNLKHLKELCILDLSGINYNTIHGLASGLRNLVNLRKLNLSSCMIRTDQNSSQLQKLGPSLKLLTKLEILDLSHNFVEHLPPEVITTFMQVKELNLSYNMLNLPLSELALFRCSCLWSKLRKLNLSHNFLCGDEHEVEYFIMKLRQFSEMQDVDLSNNTIFFHHTDYTEKKLLITARQTVKLDGVTRIPSRAKHAYSACVCKWAGFVDGYNSNCFELFRRHQTPEESYIISTNDKELKALHDQMAKGYLSGIKRNLKGMDSIIESRIKKSDNRHKDSETVREMRKYIETY